MLRGFFKFLSVLIPGLIFSLSAIATPSLLNNGITYQGRILKPDGTPLSGSNAQFILQIRSNDSYNCLLYQETRTAVDMSTANGTFSFTLNDGTGTRDVALDSGLSMERVFANQGSISAVNGASVNFCAGSPTTWTPGASDARKLVVQFKDETMPALETVPDVKINSAPFSLSAAQVAGFPSTAIVRVAEADGTLGNITPLTAVKYANLLSLSANPATSYTSYGTLSGKSLPTMGTNEVLGFDGTNWVSVPVSGGAGSVTSTMIANGAVGTAQLSSTLAINTSGNIVTSGALQGATLTAPQIYGSTAASQNIKIDGTSNAVAGNVLLATGPGAGSVGIGTTAPASTLEVLGQIAASPGTNALPGFAFSGAVNYGLKQSTGLISVVTNGTPVWSFGTSSAWGSANYSPLIALTAAGTASNPTYGFLADTGNGFYRPASSTLAFSTANAERLRIDSAGNVGIGTTSPSSKLYVAGDITAYNSSVIAGLGGPSYAALQLGYTGNGLYAPTANVTAVTTNNTERLRVDAAGNVGIGTTAPASKLDIYGGTIGASGTAVSMSATSNATTTSDAGLSVSVSSSPATAPASGISAVGFSSSVYSASANVNNNVAMAGVVGYAQYNNATGTVGSLTGLQGVATNLNTGSALFTSGGTFYVKNTGGGAITKSASVQINDAINTGGSTIGTDYGLLINSITAGAKNYAIYSTAGTNFFGGNVGIGTTAPSAMLHFLPSTGTAGTAPLKFGSGVLLATPEDGAMEYASSTLYYTIGTTRYSIPIATSAGGISNITNITSTSSISLNPVSGNSVLITSGTTSTNSTSGALIVTGGAGVSGSLNVGTNITATGSITSGSSVTAASMITPQLYGSTAPSGFIKIDGTSDTTKGNVLLASAGGFVGIGTTAPSYLLTVNGTSTATTGTTTGLSLGQTLNPAADQSAINYGADIRINTQAGTAFNYTDTNGPAAVYSQINHYGTGLLAGAASIGAVTGNANNRSTGTYTNALGVAGRVSNLSTGTITNAYGLYSYMRNSAGGTVSNGYGLYLQTPVGTFPNYFAIYSQSGTNYFGGNVGIGTTAPVANYSLTIDSGAGSPLYLNRFGNPAAIMFAQSSTAVGQVRADGTAGVIGFANSGGTIQLGVQTSSGNVGIGTTAPVALLHSMATTEQLRLGYDATHYATFVVDSAGGMNISPSNGAIKFNNGAGNFELTGLNMRGALQYINKAGSNWIPFTAINTTGSENVLDLKNIGSLTAAGNVGIGTTSPGAALDIATSGNALKVGSGAATASSMDFSGGRATFGFASGSPQYAYMKGYTLDFFSNVSATLPAMLVDANGNVGIGTTSPGVKLDIAGGLRLATNADTCDAAHKGELRFNSNGLQLEFCDGGYWGLLIMNGYQAAFAAGAAATPAVAFNTDYNSGMWNPAYGSLAFSTNSAERIRILSSGYVGIGTTSPGYKLDVNGDIRVSGTPYHDGGSIAWQVTSDGRLKDITGDFVRGLHEIVNLKTITFKYKQNNAKHIASDKEYSGVIAQDAQKLIPEAVQTDKDGWLSLNTTPIFWAMVNSIKELYNQALNHESRLKSLERANVQRSLASIEEKSAQEARASKLEFENEKLKAENAAIKAWVCGKDPSAAFCPPAH